MDNVTAIIIGVCFMSALGTVIYAIRNFRGKGNIKINAKTGEVSIEKDGDNKTETPATPKQAIALSKQDRYKILKLNDALIELLFDTIQHVYSNGLTEKSFVELQKYLVEKYSQYRINLNQAIHPLSTVDFLDANSRSNIEREYMEIYKEIYDLHKETKIENMYLSDLSIIQIHYTRIVKIFLEGYVNTVMGGVILTDHEGYEPNRNGLNRY